MDKNYKSQILEFRHIFIAVAEPVGRFWYIFKIALTPILRINQRGTKAIVIFDQDENRVEPVGNNPFALKL